MSYKYQWLQCFVAGVIVVLLPVLIINLLIDPLWMISGNRLDGMNFAWNERQAKVNRLSNGHVQTGFLVLGTSRSTLLDENLINGGNTFNFAVSGARLWEYVELARYFRQQGYYPDKVIIEVSREQFIARPDGAVLKLQPSSLVPTLLSIGTLRFSLLSLLDRPPLLRYYDADFQCKVLPNLSRYLPDRGAGVRTSQEFSLEESLETLFELRELFPRAEFVGYLAPRCAFGQKRLYLNDTELYAKIPRSLLTVFDKVIDVSLPSTITLDPSNTYDGSHYYPEVMNRVARTIDGHPDAGLNAVMVTDDKHYVDTIVSRMEGVRFASALANETLERESEP